MRDASPRRQCLTSAKVRLSELTSGEDPGITGPRTKIEGGGLGAGEKQIDVRNGSGVTQSFHGLHDSVSRWKDGGCPSIRREMSIEGLLPWAEGLWLKVWTGIGQWAAFEVRVHTKTPTLANGIE